MPKLTRPQIEERERFAVDAWKTVWRKLKPGQNVPATTVNDTIFAKYKERMRSDKVYRLRDQAIQELRDAGVTVVEPARKPRPAGTPAAPPSRSIEAARGKVPARAPRDAGGEVEAGLPQIITGLARMQPVQAVERVLRVLVESNQINLHVAHSGDDYVVINALP